MGRKTLSILGSTGSVGTQTLEVCKARGFFVCGLAAYSNVKLLAEQARIWKPEKVCIFCKDKVTELKSLLSDMDVEIVCGLEGLCEIAVMSKADVVVNAVVGMIGLKPTLEAIKAGKDIALANKETLVAGGSLVTRAAEQYKVKILPVDSEHSAVFQCLQGNKLEQVKRIFLTASGGPFFGKTKEALAEVTVSDALNHPNWSMGAKITIDSATMMNKGLEFIEAMWLFDLKPEQIEVVIHRESVVHSAVEYRDHSVIAQMGVPDMKIPIQYALTYPERESCPVRQLSLFDYEKLTFSRPDLDTFTCLKSCMEAIRIGGLLPAAVNGANEQAVELFLDGKISFLQIGELVGQVLNEMPNKHNFDLDDIISTDTAARELVLRKVNETYGKA